MHPKLSSDQELKLMSANELNYQIDRLNLGNWFNQICEALLKAIVRSSEPNIEQVIDRKGHVCWYIHDPATRQSFYCSSEAEVRLWLEQRYILK